MTETSKAKRQINQTVPLCNWFIQMLSSCHLNHGEKAVYSHGKPLIVSIHLNSFTLKF